MKTLGNVTPLISIEGNPEVSDIRRGGSNVHQQSFEALEYCREEGLITGVATSLCRTNIDDLLTENFLDQLTDRGALYMWYYIYRPVGSDPQPELALTDQQILQARKFIVEMRCRKPIMLVDAYWDHEGRGLCPAAVGISHHINPWGDIEPCPPLQFAVDNISQGELGELMQDSQFLTDFRKMAAETTRGCILLDNPERLAQFLRSVNAAATSRHGGIEEIDAMTRLPSHDQPENLIPEKHPFYRFAKKHWFFGFGAYG